MAEFDGAIVDPASPATVTIPRADLDAAIEAMQSAQMGLKVLANMLKRLKLDRGEAVAVSLHRENDIILANLKGHRDAS